MGAKNKPAALTEDRFHAVSRALSDPRRFAIFAQIAQASAKAPLTCSALAMQDEIGPATISHHLKELQEAGLVTIEREGRAIRLAPVRTTWKAYLKRLSQI